MSYSTNLISKALSHSQKPMEVEGGMREGSASSLVFNFLEASNREVLSPEDFAWIDSCLIYDSSFIERNWDSVKEALLETYISNPASLNSAVLRDFHRRIHSENCSSSIAEPGNFQGETNCDNMLIEAGTPETSDYSPSKSSMFPEDVYEPILLPNYSDNLCQSIVTDLGFSADRIERSADIGKTPISSNTHFPNPFRSGYNDDIPGSKSIRLGLDISSSPYQYDSSTEDISELWDVNTQMEENEFIKKWNMVFAESSSHSEPPNIYNTGARKDSTEISIDHLDTGLARISLHGHSS